MPHDTVIEATTTTVKLLSPGKGKRLIAKIAPTQGAKTPVELRVDFKAVQDDHPQPFPTMILRGDAEAVTTDKDGTQWKWTVANTDTHYDGISANPQLETALRGIRGMTWSGSVAPNGSEGAITLHADAVDDGSAQLMDLLKLTSLPMWPVLPAEAIAPGAKWETTTKLKLVEQLDVTEVVDYELVAYKDKTWTIKGTVKLSGAEQTIEGAKFKDIDGSGTVEATLVDGALIPTQHSTLNTSFAAVGPQGQVVKASLALANSIGVEPSAPAVAK